MTLWIRTRIRILNPGPGARKLHILVHFFNFITKGLLWIQIIRSIFNDFVGPDPDPVRIESTRIRNPALVNSFF
jgi:hypothetical protein